MTRAPLALFTYPWRGEVGSRNANREGVTAPKITPPRLASSMLADPPPPGEGEVALS